MAVGRSLLIVCLAVLPLAGCGERPEIRTYRTPRRDRMIVALVESDAATWFFRLAGQRERVDAVADAFERFVDSLSFAGAGQGGPTWKLPAGWKELPKTAPQNLNPSFPRFATIQIEDTKRDPLEIAVTRLPAPTVDPLALAAAGFNRWLLAGAGGELLTARGQFLLGNVNRWLGQLRRSAAEPAELAMYVRPHAVGELRVIVFDATGFLKATPPPPAAPQPDPHAGAPTGDPPAEDSMPPEEGEPPFALGKPPAAWRPAQRDQFSVESFAIEQGGLAALYTVSPFPASGPISDRLQNVNRWRRQLGLEPWTQQDLGAGAKVFSIGSRDGIFVEFSGTNAQGKPASMLGVMVEADGAVWFFKLSGDAELVARERDNFRKLVAETTFSAAKE